ncbi:hypothetical protein BDV34DRAFT_190636 [Aspergillus parasiticus]|uniref:Uncharacterized protein n=1 Tax=Aspergillus parasiticus TaxID=5067 RepID=A0A5N6DT07_ASPPA|nr:hypothetical protein BDV34DRAFT_190636 [Aspergillus parasiticus]
MAQYGSFGFLAGTSMHEVLANFRLITAHGIIPNNFITRRIANDTGSDIQTIFVSDLEHLQYNPQTYVGIIGPRPIHTPSGIMIRVQILIEVQIVNPRGEAITPWFVQIAIVTPDAPGLVRLSGEAMRSHLFFATAPGNGILYVAKKKNGIVSRLPVV